MRISPIVGALAVALAATLAIAGCVQPPPRVIPTAQPSAKPVFKTDAAALAAAKKAYLAYLAVSDQILADGGNDSRRLLAVATRAKFKNDDSGFAKFRAEGWHSTGRTALDSITLQSYSPFAKKDAVIVYACIDVTKLDVLDATGASMISSTRPDLQPLQTAFDLTSDKPAQLLVASEEPWSGPGVCP